MQISHIREIAKYAGAAATAATTATATNNQKMGGKGKRQKPEGKSRFDICMEGSRTKFDKYWHINKVKLDDEIRQIFAH